MMTPSELAAIKARAEAATPGPWTTRPVDEYGELGWDAVFPLDKDGSEIGAARCVNIHDNEENDAKFIAHARTDVPALLAMIEELQNERLQSTMVSRKEAEEHGEYFG